MKWAILVALLAAWCGIGAQGQAAGAQRLRVFAASDLQPVMPAFAYAYEKKTGVKLAVTFGSSSTLATQILNGAPADVFLAADFVFPEKVVAAGLAVEKLPVQYAEGTLVLWARKDLSVQPLSVDLLTDARVTRVAVADEFHAPYGRAAYGAMRWLKIEEKVERKLVKAENVAEAAQMVEAGKAQMGFVSLTMAMSAHMKDVGTYAMVPAIYPKIKQCAVVMAKSPNAEEGKRFLEWVLSPEVQGHLKEFGLTAVR